MTAKTKHSAARRRHSGADGKKDAVPTTAPRACEIGYGKPPAATRFRKG